MSFPNYQSQNDIDRGRAALRYFHNQASTYAAYDLTFDELISKLGGKVPAYFLEGLGMSCVDVPEYQVKQAMEALANAGQGRLPAQPFAFYKAISDRASILSVRDWVSAAPAIAVETAKDVAAAAQGVGQTVIQTASSLKSILPLLIVGAVVFVVVSKARKIAA